MVKFTKEQINALAQIEVKANQYFDEDIQNMPNVYRESDRKRVVNRYMANILRVAVADGVIYGV